MRPAKAANPSAVPNMLNALTVVDDEQSAMRYKTATLPRLCDLLGPTALLWSADKRENLWTTHAYMNLTPTNWCFGCEHAREQAKGKTAEQHHANDRSNDDFATHGRAA